MASFDLFFPKLLKLEGGFVNHPADPGGATNKGITIATWRLHGYDKDGDGDVDVDDLKIISEHDAYVLYKYQFWNKINADAIINQQVAEQLFDFYINAPSVAVKLIQRIINNRFKKNLLVDGIAGVNTLQAINSVNPQQLHDAYREARIYYYRFRAGQTVPEHWSSLFRSIGASGDTKYSVFLTGWLNRAGKFIFEKKKLVSYYCR